ncbi:MAG: carbohydrate-binding domain-containing protein [Acidimicrobiales bacterium]
MIRSRRLLRRLLALPGAAALTLAACSSSDGGTTAPDASATIATMATAGGSGTEATPVTAATAATAVSSSGSAELAAVARTVLAENHAYHDPAEDLSWDETDESTITLQGSSATTDADGVRIDGTTVTITSAGTYRISGTLTDGQVVVAVEGDGVVRLVLDGVDLTSSTTAALAVEGAERVVVVLAEGTTNVLTDGATRAAAGGEDEAGAALTSRADLLIAGTGTLEVHGRYADGISGADDVVISGATVLADALDDAIRGKDALVLIDAAVTVRAGGDGLKADDLEDQTRGYVAVLGGTVSVTAAADGVDAATDLVLAGTDLSISAGDDGLHAEAVLAVADGTVDITDSYEGIEAAAITIAAGSLTVRSTDDGINAVGTGATLAIDGGTVRVDAGGDGVDVNGSITMTGGTLLVQGPTAQMNAAIDYDGSFDISGGLVVATGSSGMAMAPSSSSAQRSLLATFATQAAGTVVHVVAADGTPIVTFAPSKAYQALTVSSPDLADGVTYQVVTGGTASGEADFGLFASDAHGGGTVLATTTTADAVSRTGGPGARGAFPAG